jgi:Asp-tRNA(Asn)/Glu-tRNA(Gln) amidotransferase A subunit family amidase
VTIPVVLPDVDGPMAVSLIAAPGHDAMLLELALALAPRIQSAVVHLRYTPLSPPIELQI